MKARRGRCLSLCCSSVYAIGLLGLMLVIALFAPAQASASFPDVGPTHPYAEAIGDMAARGIVNGYENGQFGPDDQVSRQQFAKMIVLSLELPVSEDNVSDFTDVDHDLSPTDPLYPDNYVAVCAAWSITTGVTSTTFRPYANMTRAQLITMVARSPQLPDPPLGYSPPFANFDPTHYPLAKKAAYAGLLEGLQGMGAGYNFWQPASRGEVCQVLHNLLEWNASALDEIRQAIEESASVAVDFEILDYEILWGEWAGVIVSSPTAPDSSVLLERDADGWVVVGVGDNLSYEDWLDWAPPEDLASFLSRSGELGEIRQALADSGSFADDFDIGLYLIHGDYAGVIVSSPMVDDCSVLLRLGSEGWAILAFGTDLSQDDWLGHGAPLDIAEFLSPWPEAASTGEPPKGPAR